MSITQNTRSHHNAHSETHTLERNPSKLRDAIPLYITPLLNALSATPETAEYYLALIEPLQQYDLDHSSDLMGTLTQYLYHNGNVTHASQALYLHRSTLLHRLGRITTLISFDLSDPHLRLALWIAVLLTENS